MSDAEISAAPRIYDDAQCTLGEGPLWHPERQQLFWFDIAKQRLLSRTEAEGRKVWQFDEAISAAGWVDRSRLLIASEFTLSVMDVDTGDVEFVAELDSENQATRSNDGRADPWGGFWIGTMGKEGEPEMGAIYRYYKGELRKLFAKITISNAIAFPPEGGFATFADTAKKTVWKVALDEADGWPKGEPELFIDFGARMRNPDGAVFDAAGRFWCAEWGSSRVSCYDTAGQPAGYVSLAARHTSCPAFGGADLATMFVTSAREGLTRETCAIESGNGQTFAVDLGVTGQAEHRVVL